MQALLGDNEPDNEPGNRLPQRLFATDRFPIRLLNIYSKPDMLAFVHDVLRDTSEFQTIRDSCFGKLFDLPARQCPVSCKLIHSLLSRQLLVDDPHTLWTTFSGQPLRFGLQEFGTITGLPCGAFPVGHLPPKNKRNQASKDKIWKKLIDGVLIAYQQTPRPTLKYVQMVDNLETFFQFPWGRESFCKTLACMKPQQGEDPSSLVRGLKQETLHLKGVPLVLQLVAVRAIPKLLSIIPAPRSSLTIMELEEDHLLDHPSININDVLTIEAEENLSVTPIIPIERQADPGWGVWPDIVNDERLAYMEELIADKRPFKKWMWPGGDTSLPLIPPPTVEEKPVHKKALKPKHTGKNKPLQPNRSTRKTSTTRKQRRISNYFVRNGSTSNKSYEELLEIITELSSQVTAVQAEQKRLLEMIEKLKQRPHTKRSPITSLLPRMKKFKKRRRQKSQSHSALEPTDSPLNNTMSSPLHHEDDTSCQSPILSQYAAQHHRSNVDNIQDSEPLTQKSPDHISPIHKSPDHISPIHKSPDPSSPVQTSPSPERKYPIHIFPFTSPSLHVSAVHTSPVHTTPELPGLENFEPIYDQTPADDGLELPFTPQPPLSPITCPHLTPNPSPTKSTDTGSGFPQHATSVNAFTATASSSRIPHHNSPVENHQGGQNESEVMELSDSSSAREALTHTPSDAEMHLANELLRCPLVPSQRLISPLPLQIWELFHDTISSAKNVFHTTPSKFDFSNKFLLELSVPTHWTTTYHIEILMYMLVERHAQLLQGENLLFSTPHLTSIIQQKWRKFKAARIKDTFHWDKRISDFITTPGKKWMEDVTTVYTPMIWADRHWVGLAINLDVGLVEILDPNPTLYSDSKVAEFIEPVTTSLPYLIKRFADPQLTQFRHLSPFAWNRIPDLYSNQRSGDCGPVSVKFLEMHAHGDPEPNMSSLTDENVDDLRKQYTLDVYKTIVLPAYHPPLN
uniref:Ubiquitin-like protease family profile domain-containing protein n=1 Tax=Brassica oleracea var. oleracea TaxID=109376 RepID=A0A0D3B5F8_BRAOL